MLTRSAVIFSQLLEVIPNEKGYELQLLPAPLLHHFDALSSKLKLLFQATSVSS